MKAQSESAFGSSQCSRLLCARGRGGEGGGEEGRRARGLARREHGVAKWESGAAGGDSGIVSALYWRMAGLFVALSSLSAP